MDYVMVVPAIMDNYEVQVVTVPQYKTYSLRRRVKKVIKVAKFIIKLLY